MTKDLKPADTFIEEARKLVDPDDGWMTPTMECREEDKTDYASFLRSEREGWEETVHFTIYYRRQLDELVNKAAALAGFVEDDYVEPAIARYEMFYLPLLDAFWDAWADHYKLLERWRKEISNVAAKRGPPVGGPGS